MKKSVLGLSAAAIAAMTATGCSGTANRSPDEFRVVRKAPLTVPPEFNLRPPAQGESLPTELRREDQAQAVIFGQAIGGGASDGEKLFVAKAGADAIDPKIRATVDYDASGTLRKDESFSDKILSFGGSDKKATIINPDAEAERLDEEADSATGGGKIVIERRVGDSKLPGL